MGALRTWSQDFYRLVTGQSTLDLVTRLTLVMLVLSDWVVGDAWLFKLPLRLLALAGLLLPPLHCNRYLWLVLTLVMAGKTADRWWTQDNHLFLLTYWSLALTIALFSSERGMRILATNARLLIGGAFLFAALWKGLLSPDFMDGTYFHYSFLTDQRFNDLAQGFGGLSQDLAHYNQQQLTRLSSIKTDIPAVQLRAVPQLVTLAKAVTWWTIAIEAALALVFLWPGKAGPARWRDAVLLVFSWTTYMAADVETFGWTLLILGLAQCETERHTTRFLYVLTCGLVLLYDYVPILSIFN